jgi:hypothetical protein
MWNECTGYRRALSTSAEALFVLSAKADDF